MPGPGGPGGPGGGPGGPGMGGRPGGPPPPPRGTGWRRGGGCCLPGCLMYVVSAAGLVALIVMGVGMLV